MLLTYQQALPLLLEHHRQSLRLLLNRMFSISSVRLNCPCMCDSYLLADLPITPRLDVLFDLQPVMSPRSDSSGPWVCSSPWLLSGVTAEYLVSSIDGLTQQTNVSREFVGLILLPVIGNAVEHVTAVTVSVKDKLNLSMSIAVGSSIQVSLCLLPILVLIGWGIGQPMMLFFDTFETITLVIAILIVNFAISDGRTNYLEGFCMMMAWVSIALVTWYYDPVY